MAFSVYSVSLPTLTDGLLLASNINNAEVSNIQKTLGFEGINNSLKLGAGIYKNTLS